MIGNAPIFGVGTVCWLSYCVLSLTVTLHLATTYSHFYKEYEFQVIIQLFKQEGAGNP